MFRFVYIPRDDHRSIFLFFLGKICVCGLFVENGLLYKQDSLISYNMCLAFL